MNQYALLFVGILIGGIAAAGLMGMLNSLKARRLRRENERREEIISSVEETWVDVDNIVSSFRSGRLSPEAFREAIDGKIESINRLYKPGIHQLDIFFIKYTEKLIDDYRRMTSPAEPARAVPAAAPAADAVSFPEAPVSEAAVDLPVPVPAAPPETPEPVSEIDFPVQEEDQSISEAAEAAATDSNLQLESFLEMEPGSVDAGSIERVEEPEIEKVAGAGVSLPEAGMISQEPVFEPEAKAEFEDRGSLPLPPAEDSGVPQSQEDGQGSTTSFDEESFLPPPPADIDTAGPDISESETIVQSPPSRFAFSGRVTSEQDFEPVPPPPPQDMPPPAVQPPRAQPFSLPSRSPAGHKLHTAPPAPAYRGDEVTQPATIFDVEAETIIVDRSTIMGAMKTASAQDEQKEPEKKSIGITGEDVSDTFDKFFGLGK